MAKLKGKKEEEEEGKSQSESNPFDWQIVC